MVIKSGNSERTPNTVDRAGFDWKKGLSSWVMWVSSDPSSKEVTELAQCYPKVVELSEDEIKEKMEDWLAKGLVARSLGWRVQAEVAAHGF